MYDTAFEIAPGGALAPGIVKRWEVAPDGLSWVLYIRDDVVFHDGSKLTAEDVAFSYDRAATSERSLLANEWIAMLGKKPRIEVVDKYTVRVYTSGPQPEFAVLSTKFSPSLWIMPKAYIEKNGMDYFLQHPIGTGPYKFVRYVPGDLMEYQAVDYKHWRVNPGFDRLTVYLIPEETTRVYMLEKGLLDATPVSLEAAVALKAKGFTTREGSVGVAQLWPMGAFLPEAKGKPLADVRVRKALSLAINRQEIIDTLFHGFGSIPGPLRAGWEDTDLARMTPETLAKWKAWVAENYRYDPTEAKRLIAEAGYGAGFTFDVSSAPDNSAPFLQDVIVICTAYWKKVGANANVINLDAGSWKTVRKTSVSTKLVGNMGADATDYPRPSTLDSWDRFTQDQGSMDVFRGAPRGAEYDALYVAATNEMDVAKRAKMLDQMMEIVMPEWPGIATVASPAMYAFGPRVNVYLPLPLRHIADYYADWKYTGVEPKK
jgi:peptide/nickel transport system substrate-binding protein